MDKALIIRKHWLDLIFSGRKPWEMRSSRTNVRGTIGLIEAGSGLIVGVTDLVDCLPEIDPAQAHETIKYHQVEDAWLLKNGY